MALNNASTKRSEQVLEALNLYYGFRHCRTFTFSDDSSGSVSGQYFDLNIIDENYEEVQYYVLLQGTTPVTDPAPAGKTKIEVTFADNDTGADIAALFVAELAALNVQTALVGAAAQIENSFIGIVQEESMSNAASVSLEVLRVGSGGFLGAIAQGGGTLSAETTTVDITSDQTGGIILDQIIQGSAISFEVNLVEMTRERWKFLIGQGYGDVEVLNPSLDELIGYGTSKLYRSSFDFAGQLVGHPIRLPLSDRSADICIWQASANLGSINFSGQDVQAGAFTFTALQAKSKPAKVDLFALGDHSQL